MQNTFQLIVGQRGVITLPKSVREAYELPTGKTLTLIDLGGVFILSPKTGEADALADRLAGALKAQGETLESLMTTVREARAGYDH